MLTRHSVLAFFVVDTCAWLCSLVVLRALEEEADALDLNLEQLEAEKKGLEEKAAAERAEAKSAIKSLEERMQQQQEAQERELEEQQVEKRCVAVCTVCGLTCRLI